MMLERFAPAKINLGLAITGRRADGYHELSSVFLRVGLSDRLTSLPAPATASRDSLEVVGERDHPTDGDLVLRAADLVRELTGAPFPALTWTLDKQIAVGAGLGGGSSDAAAALEMACEAWSVGITCGPAELASRLGADVPFFAAAVPAAHITGIGERVEPIAGPRDGVGVLLVVPPERLSTLRVYAAFDELPPTSVGAERVVAELSAALSGGLDGTGLAAWSERLAGANDLWPAAARVAPALELARTDLEGALGQQVLLSGSGPTLVALYPSDREAAEAGRRLAASLPGSLLGSSLIATDITGPHPTWRYP